MHGVAPCSAGGQVEVCRGKWGESGRHAVAEPWPSQASQLPLKGRSAFDLAFDFDLSRPVKPRWPNAGLNPWVTRQDAGLAALGQGWPIAAAHGFKPAFGYTEPRRGAEWWGEDFLVTFVSLQK